MLGATEWVDDVEPVHYRRWIECDRQTRYSDAMSDLFWDEYTAERNPQGKTSKCEDE